MKRQKKTDARTLKLSSETLRHLSKDAMRRAAGGRDMDTYHTTCYSGSDITCESCVTCLAGGCC